MSAQPIEPIELEDQTTQPRLQLLPTSRPTISTLGFVGVVVVLVAIGMGLVMIVSTSVAAQSKELTQLRSQATQLGYQAAALSSELQTKSSSSALAMRATVLGMVPNPYPAFLQLADGKIIGTPTKVTGREVSYLRRATAPASVQPQPQVVVRPSPPTSRPVNRPASPNPNPQAANRPVTANTPAGGQP